MTGPSMVVVQLKGAGTIVLNSGDRVEDTGGNALPLADLQAHVDAGRSFYYGGSVSVGNGEAEQELEPWQVQPDEPDAELLPALILVPNHAIARIAAVGPRLAVMPRDAAA